MLVMTDVDDVMCPAPEALWLPPLESSRNTLLTLLKRLPTLFGESKTLASSMGAAIKSAVLGAQWAQLWPAFVSTR